VTLQAALGIWTLLMVAPLPLSLLHQATAMLVLTAATVQAALSVVSAPRTQPIASPGFLKTAE
jgi:heme A synthase